MNLIKIRQILEMPLEDSFIEQLILKELALDEKVLPMMLEIIHLERQIKSELIDEMNLELSRADVFIEDNRAGGKEFVSTQIFEFYKRNLRYVQHRFREDAYFEIPRAPIVLPKEQQKRNKK